MTLDDFHDYMCGINDRFLNHWKFMNEHHPKEWPLAMEREAWVELIIQFFENDRTH